MDGRTAPSLRPAGAGRGHARLEPGQGGDDGTWLLLVDEVPGAGDGVDREAVQRALEQLHLRCADVPVVADPPDHEPDGTRDLGEMGCEFDRLPRVRHGEVRLERRI